MTTFIIRRLLQSVIVLVLVSVIVFLAIRLLPGDPILVVVSNANAQSMSAEQMAQLRHEFGLDQPIPIQYLNWLGGIFQGDLGTSIYSRTPVSVEIFRRLPITFEIGILAIILGAIIGIPLGIIAAVRRGQWLDSVVVFASNIGICIPTFWIGLILMLIFGLALKWLPVMGYTSPFEDVGLHFAKIVMPVFVLSIFPLASTARQTRSSMLEVMHQDYIRTAWSKGLKERKIIFRHALKNGLIPVITTIGLSVPMTVGGSVIIETVFNIPGMGRLAVSSVQNQDYAYVQGIILIIALMVVIVNLLVELAYGWADPRIRYN
jgi:peptide/nickel transport system permease protein